MPPKKMTARRKKSTAVKSEPELAEKETQVQVSNPDPAVINGDSTSESTIKEEVVLENRKAGDVGSDKFEEDLRLRSEDVDKGEQEVHEDEIIDDDKEDLQKGSENVDEEKQEAGVEKDENKVVSLDGSQSQTVAVVRGDGDGDEVGEKIAEVVTALESNISKSPSVNDAAVVVNDGSNTKDTAETFFTQESVHAVSTNAPCENNTALAVEDDPKEIGDDEGSDDDSEGDDTDNEGDDDPLQFVQDPLPDNKKDKGIEIYVGRLDKNTVEEDLVNVFQQFGELKSTRIVRNSTTKKSKGYAFVRFASADQAKRALSELKDGVEVRGKHVKISASQDNDTLYLGNICKTWKNEEVLQQLKLYGIEHIEMIRLPEDPKIDGKIKGYAFLEFNTHSDAVAAFQRLRKPDAIFGRDISAKVAFAQTPMHPSDEDLSQVTRVYVEGLANDWDEEKLKGLCEKYGEVAKVKLCQSSRNKHRGFAFVTFVSHESALACVEGINNAGDAEVKIKVSIAKPQHKSRLQKQGFRGGFKVEKQRVASALNKDVEISKGTSEAKPIKTKGGLNSQQARKNRKGSFKKQNSGGKFKVLEHNQPSPVKKEGESSKEAELSKMKGDLSSQQAKRKRKASSEQNVKAPPDLRHGAQGISKKPKVGGEGQNSKIASKEGGRKRKKATKYEGHGDGGNRNTHSKKPFKKQKGYLHGRERDDSRNPRRDTHIRKGHDEYRNSTRYIDPYAPTHAVSHAYRLGPDSMSTRRHQELEPHAGYIESAATPGRSYSGYIQPVVRNLSQHQTVYLSPAGGSQSQLHSRYIDPSAMRQSYMETTVGAEVQAYRQSAIVRIAHDSYDPGLARAVRHDGRGSGVVTYVGGRPLPATQVGNHTSYYQGGGSYRTYY